MDVATGDYCDDNGGGIAGVLAPVHRAAAAAGHHSDVDGKIAFCLLSILSIP